jgi:hypothetical protein
MEGRCVYSGRRCWLAQIAALGAAFIGFDVSDMEIQIFTLIPRMGVIRKNCYR